MADEEYTFDDNTAQGWTLVAEPDWIVEVSASAGLNGTPYGLRFYNSVVSTNDGYAHKTLATTYSDIYVQLRMKFDSSFSLGIGSFIRILGFGQTSIFDERGQLQVWNDGGVYKIRDNIGLSTTEISIGTEYLIETRFVRDAANGGFQVWVDGNLEINDLNYNTNISDIGHIDIGVYTTSASVTAGSNAYFDEVKVDASFIGTGSVGIIPVMLHHYRSLR